MTNGMTLYAYTFRSRAERVLWALKELDFAFSLVRIDPFEEDHIHPQLLKLNPDGKVPILVHDGNVFLESLAIMEYLNSISSTKHLIPADTNNNYDFRKTLHYGLTEIEPYLWLAEQANGPVKKYHNWPKGVYEESISHAKKACHAAEAFLGNKQYMIEYGFSIADIYYYHLLTWAKQHGIQYSINTETYLAQLEKRDSFPEDMFWKKK